MKVLRCLLLCAAVVFSASAAHAQDVRFGVKGGFDASWITNTEIIGDEVVVPHNNFYLGGLVSCDLTDWFYLQGELLYAGKGHSDKSELRGRYSRSLSYLEIPVFAGFNLIRDFSIAVGPEFGFLMWSRSRTSAGVTKNTSDCNRFNIALALQTCYMVTYNLGIEMKFDWGMNNTFNFGDRGRNMSIGLGVCYKFD